MRVGGIVLGSLVFFAGIAAGITLAGYTNAAIKQQPQDFQDEPVPTLLDFTEAPHANEASASATLTVKNSTDVQSIGPSNLPDLASVAEQTVAAVTNISSRQVVQRRNIFENDPFFRYFFGDAQDVYSYRERPSLGSGVIVSADGYILTNAHVVGRRTAGITVTLADKREFVGELVGRDESTDIALLRVDARNLSPLPWGDSSMLRIAEWVLAVGNPFQLSQTVTLGIVSAVGRDNLGVARYEDFIQTDAAINPGNSGGALINARGKLVGINTAIYSESGGYQGVGFAVPSNLARRVMQDLSDYGEVRRGSFGYVDVRALSPQLARELGAPNTRGAVVWRIHQESAAARAGIEPGDIIVSLNDTPIDDPAEYTRRLSDAEIGSIVTVGIIRSGERLQLAVPVSQARS